MKKDYYELLEVETTAAAQDIKKAYRKQALKYHPDKHPGEEEQYNEIFAEYTAAYEVLMDPQERAWYDSHKSRILREETNDYDEFEDYNTGVTADDLLQFFDPKLYRRVDDTIAGLYKVAGRVFETVASDEIALGQDPSKFPLFGDSSAPYDTEVRKFYSLWSQFATEKPFLHKEEFRMSHGMDRRSRRAVDKSNKKARDAARKEYNETVRSFVIFVKKRDPRVKSGVRELERKRKEKARLEAEKQRQQKQQMQQMQQQMEQFELQDWQQPDEDSSEGEYGVFEDRAAASSSSAEEAEEAEEAEIEIFECVACNKQFKSANQLEAHERSKKHRKEVQRLAKQMRQEGKQLGLD